MPADSFSGSVPVADRLFRWALLSLDVGGLLLDLGWRGVSWAVRAGGVAFSTHDSNIIKSSVSSK